MGIGGYGGGRMRVQEGMGMGGREGMGMEEDMGTGGTGIGGYGDGRVGGYWEHMGMRGYGGARLWG